MSDLDSAAKFQPEGPLLDRLVAEADLSPAMRARISDRAAALVRRIRSESKPTMMELMLAEYGLSTREGVALMCLAEAMLRVPDRHTIDALIEDKIAPSDWGRHLGESSSSLVNASTWALMLTGRVLDADQPGLAGTLRGAIRRLGEPVIRKAVTRAMREMGRQFVLGQTIGAALDRARAQEAKGYSYSYDMLGEAAMTAADAARYAEEYRKAIAAIAGSCDRGSVRRNPGISIKLSALHPRYEVAQRDRVMAELVPVVLELALQARAADMGLNVDAEEQDRLALSLEVIEAVMADPRLAGWDGFGVVVQAYGKRAGAVIDRLHALAERLDRRIMVRLVKGAYWDTEMKRAQVEGHPDFPLFTSKTATDVSYMALARKLLAMTDRIYPQFATHNAHSVAAVLEMAGNQGLAGGTFEFQRLHGMGERLHDIVLRDHATGCRIYAPVGAHQDLLAYLVRRLLENGANSSFVNQIVDEDVTPEEIARDPFDALPTARAPQALLAPAAIYGAGRVNAAGFDLTADDCLARIFAGREAPLADAAPIIAGHASGRAVPVVDPATGTPLAQVTEADEATVAAAIAAARPWDAPAPERARILRAAADLYEAEFGPIFGILAREAGKTLNDAVGELREAVDFLRYYPQQGEGATGAPRGIIAAISPWNFPLAIFTGQIAAALMAGNAVLAKPAEQTPLIAAHAVGLLHRAGVPVTALQLLPGDGATVGAALTRDPRIDGVVFTGGTDTARLIAASMADHMAPGTPLVAETGGLNAMIVDSTALPEQAVRDIVASSFRSAGQRCSALRCLYVQEDVAPKVIEMIRGAMDELRVGDPWDLATDVGPVIDAEAQAGIMDYLAARQGDILHRLPVPDRGHFVPPSLIRVPGIEALDREIFGPVLHVATFKARDLDRVVAAINARGYGLTFGLHTRIDDRVQQVTEAVHVGNIYVNRNQVGATVGSQPFGGEGLSGTGPKAGGPLYLPRFLAPASPMSGSPWPTGDDPDRLTRALAAPPAAPAPEEMLMPGPTGELNRLRILSRGPILCLGPGADAAAAQARAVTALGGQPVEAQGHTAPEALADLPHVTAVLWWGDAEQGRAMAQALARRDGPLVPLITAMPDRAHVSHERHLCVDTTAAGGNAALLAG
ncbi:bifunctional proline dehydrogenase/L-glutamate gamma-semialdehyde dehydrogenase PutA [Paracoccus aestuarii]|uniref:Bifunctional protein PutA n=1 Tax=Paracoccus aestuarii TaxID=453842 RepID=A0A418ZST4_9RHOB|nr:bifunctional proline dehydrogenase/L-glutamate gamma-semialdehyde dehydrogenase PutA [Paracoccus aestuarii]RJL00505.1 bifunctional proline dehydrogenase/L-glutamate gamma-semialdehyde dehydrogenase PutA [Paracoccus aestuarii]WCR01142.1 bifunctional proline dehydrogenase/L-glutamate gamma-semialdehyde dehydrogenase PutA [Paracoccus aestuarii]